ncbi:MAG TPA: hypothetical protein VMP11_17500 [Verrucomicrobiae bacterium]|nr:hypothetical protein [Verrucomicrobiae bacterium]
MAACSTPSETLEPSFVQTIATGQSRDEVRKLLGQPNWSRGLTGSGSADTFLYTELVNSSTSPFPSARDLKARAFSVRYDASGRVQKTLFYESRTPATMYHSSCFAGPQINDQAPSNIHIGVTTREDLERMFPKPLVINLHPVQGLELHWFQIAIGASFTHFEDEQGLHILVDDGGVVRDVAFHSTAER